MVDDGVKYETKSVKAIRGVEARSISKWQKGGWELVDQHTGPLHTTLDFRRAKPKVPWIPIAALGGVVLVLALVGGIASALEGEDDKAPAPSKPAAAASEVSTESPQPDASEPTQADAEQIVTRENNDEFAALLAVSDYCDAGVEAFAAKYGGKTIEFDASIAGMAPHGSYDTRYDILLAPGDKGAESTEGPAFKFEDVNVPELRLIGANVPDDVGPGDLLHVVAAVGQYNADQCLLFLEPVATGLR